MGKSKKEMRDLGAENTANMSSLKSANISSFDMADLNEKLRQAYQTVYDSQQTEIGKQQRGEAISVSKDNNQAGTKAWDVAVAEYDQTVASIKDQMSRASAGTEAKYKNRKYLDEQNKLLADQPGKKQVNKPLNLQPVVPSANTSELK